MSKCRLTAVAIVFVLLIAVTGVLYAQGKDIQISRPLDGSTVRETVRIVVPASSVPNNGFVGYMLDGRFRSAVNNASENGGSFVYFWDTKAKDPDETLSEEQRQPREGKHTIAVEIFDAMGKKVGKSKDITVYVKNKADIPSSGIRLKYQNRLDLATDYHYKVTVSLGNIQGAKEIAATMGEAFEGTELTIRRSIEDIRPDGSYLVRQKPVGVIMTIENGRPVPMAGIDPKAAYLIEDAYGRVSSFIPSRSSGLPITIDLPNLPASRIAVGDTWTARDKVLRDVITGEAIVLNTSSSVQGAEWQKGYPCVKIKTDFSGTGKSPFPSMVNSPVNVTGSTITYFAYQVGKVVSSVTEATITGDIDQSVANQLTQKLAGAQGSQFVANAMQGSANMGSSGMPSMEGPPPGLGGPPPGSGAPGLAAPGANKVSMEFKVTQVIDLAR